jgi:hypothetical protein
MTTVADGLFQYGGMPTTGGMPPFVSKNSKVFFVDPVGGLDGNSGKSPSQAFKTLYKLHSVMTSGNNDVGFLIGNGAASGTARLSLANAQAVDSTATTGTLTWSKSACHLIGVAAPGTNARARIATPTGTYTEATFNSLIMMNVTGAGNYFANLALYQQFSTGATGEICLQVTGSYNVFNNVFIGGLQSTVAAQDATGRVLKISTGGENLFIRCQIGTDTVARTAANASVEFASGTPRNRFTECVFPTYLTGSGTGAFYILGTGNACTDRHQIFERCMFLNAIKSSGSTMTAALSFTTASPGGFILFKNCDSVGVTKWGDTNGLANSYVSGDTGAAASEGLDVNPS